MTIVTDTATTISARLRERMAWLQAAKPEAA